MRINKQPEVGDYVRILRQPLCTGIIAFIYDMKHDSVLERVVELKNTRGHGIVVVHINDCIVLKTADQILDEQGALMPTEMARVEEMFD
jgi:hypothetical protein